MKLMDSFTTIAISRKTWANLNKLKKDPKDNYDIVITDMFQQLKQKKKMKGDKDEKDK